MKGIVFNLLEEIVRRDFGEKIWDELLEVAQLNGAYTSLGSYPDDDLRKLVSAASGKFNKKPDEIVAWVGRNALPLLAKRYPKFFHEHLNTRSFILALNHIIHPEVRKLYPGANVPEFDFDTSSESILVVGYQSPRRMCSFAEGLVLGAGDYFGEKISFIHLQCMKSGDPKCIFHISFTR